VANRCGSIPTTIVVFAALACPCGLWAESETQTVVALAVALEIRTLKFAERKDVCVAVWVEDELRDPPLSLLKSPPLISFALHKMSWCAPRCRDNPKAGELPDLICDKMPRGVTIRIGKIMWNGRTSAEVPVETDDNSLKKADFGLILRKGNYRVARTDNGRWKIIAYEKSSPP
jgi:hypothetical protein